MPLSGMAGTLQAQTANSFIAADEYDICVCDQSCEFVEMAFVNIDGDWWQNDFKTMIHARSFASDTITFKLLKEGVVVATLNNNSYGSYYNFGSAVLVNPNYKGMRVEWKLVQQAFGYGKYNLVKEIVSLGATYTFTSHDIHVLGYNSRLADKTTRIETYQNGSLRKKFDYTGINWPQMLRIPGKFWDKQPELQVDNYEDQNGIKNQIQYGVADTYKLVTKLLPSEIYNYLNYDMLLANEIQITDYNLENQELFRRKRVIFVNFEQVKNQPFSRKASFVYKFEDVQDEQKRNINGEVGIITPERSGPTQIIEVKNLYIIGDWLAGRDIVQIDISSDEEGQLLSITDDGGSGTITLNINGGGYGAFAPPLNVVAGDQILIKRTITTNFGSVKLQGTYE